MTWLLWLGLVVCVLAAMALSLVEYGAHRWARATRALTSRMEAAVADDTARSPSATRYDPRELEGLPAPVQRYFRAVLKEGQPLVAGATVEMTGTFNLSATGEQWKPFTSTQPIVTRRPGFVWDARVALFPGVPVRVVDGYIVGEGLLHAAVLGLFTAAELRGGGEVARGELMRWFAEAPWYPTALLPSQGVRWEAVDDASADATLVDGPLTLTLRFSFDADGLIASARAEARGAMVGKAMVMTPWEGSWSDYQARDGMRVPMTGEAAWLRPDGRKPYFHGTVTSLAFEFSP
jgi:hypothetical protein